MSFAKAWREGNGVMTPAERALFPAEGLRVSLPTSVGWRRVRHPSGVLPRDPGGGVRVVDEDDGACAPGCRLEPQGTGARVEVEHLRARDELA
jgi:hypothetical protein